ncbi:copia protein [Tanacetum coccineum]
MERGFLSQKDNGRGRGVKDKDVNDISIGAVKDGAIPCDTGAAGNTRVENVGQSSPVGVASAVKEGVTPSMVDMTMEMEKLSSLEHTTVLGSFLPLSTSVTTTANNAPGKSSYAIVTGKLSGNKLNIRTLFKLRGNGIYVGKDGLVRSMFSLSTRLFSFQFSSMDGLDAMLENGLYFIRNNPLILKKWHPDENLFKEDVSTILIWVKFHGVPVTAFSDDGLSAIATKLGTPLILDSCTSDMCMKSWGRSSYARVMIELRADVELKDNIVVAMLRIRGRAIIYVMLVLSMSGNLLGKIRLLGNDRNLLVPTGIVKSDSEVEVVFDETANLRISTSGKDRSDKGYGINSLLEQWRDSYPDNDDYDHYDDDMYENHDLSEHLQSICYDLDITVCGRKKK